MGSLEQTAEESLKKAGISNGELVTSSSMADFGYSEVVFRVQSVLIRFVRDRGQEFVDVAFASSPHHFYQFDAIAIALGLTTIDALLARAEPLELDHVVNQLGQHIRVLEDASSGGNASAMRSRFDQAEKARGDAVMQRLRRPYFDSSKSWIGTLVSRVLGR